MRARPGLPATGSSSTGPRARWQRAAGDAAAARLPCRSRRGQLAWHPLPSADPELATQWQPPRPRAPNCDVSQPSSTGDPSSLLSAFFCRRGAPGPFANVRRVWGQYWPHGPGCSLAHCNGRSVPSRFSDKSGQCGPSRLRLTRRAGPGRDPRFDSSASVDLHNFAGHWQSTSRGF